MKKRMMSMLLCTAMAAGLLMGSGSDRGSHYGGNRGSGN